MSWTHLFTAGISHRPGARRQSRHRILSAGHKGVAPLWDLLSLLKLRSFTLQEERLQDLDLEVKADGVFLSSMGFNLSILGNSSCRWQDAGGQCATGTETCPCPPTYTR